MFGSPYKFVTYTTNEGLVHNFTKKCVQDSKGFLWIITQHGLSRFDGLQFVNYKHRIGDSTSLPVNDLEDIVIDYQDRIWLAYGRGLCVLDQRTNQFRVVDSVGKPFQAYRLSYDSARKSVWVANYTHLIRVQVDDRKTHFAAWKEPFKYRHPFGQLLLDRKGYLWVLQERSGYRYVSTRTGEQRYFSEEIWPMSVHEDHRGRIWMGTWENSFRLINDSVWPHQHRLMMRDLPKPMDVYGEIFHDFTCLPELTGPDVWWISTEANGLLLYDMRQERFLQRMQSNPVQKNGIQTDFFQQVYRGRDGILWLCSWHGLVKMNPEEQQFQTTELVALKTPYYNRVAGVGSDHQDSNYVWLAIEGSGLARFHKKAQTLERRYFYDPLSRTTDMVYNWRWSGTLVTDRTGAHWVSTYGGFLRVRNNQVDTIRLTPFDQEWYPMQFIHEDTVIWGGSFRGLIYYSVLRNESQLYQAPDMAPKGQASRIVYDVMRLNDSTLLTAGLGGYYRFHIRQKRFERLHIHTPKLDSAAQQLAYVMRKIGDVVYIGTSAGLLSYDLKTGNVEAIGFEMGIDKIYDRRLQVDASNRLWIYTSTGLFRYDPSTKRIQQYKTQDGIYDFSDDPIGFFRYEDHFYIGYRGVVTGFDPLRVNQSIGEIEPVLTEVQVNGQARWFIPPIQAELFVIPYSDRNLRFVFTGVDFTNSNQMQFSCKLEGFDVEWSTPDVSRERVFNNLRPGTYTFWVKVANSNGLWGEPKALFRFTIATPFWMAWWFFVLIGLLVIAAFYVWYRARVNRLRKSYAMRNTISRNLHDEIGAAISSINIYSDVAKQKTQEAETAKLLEKIYATSARIMESMNDIVWYINPKNDAMDEVEIRMREFALPLLDAKGIACYFQVDPVLKDVRLSMQQRQHLYLLFKEAINNAVKYAQASEVSVALYREGKRLHLDVVDNGIGFDMTRVKAGNGLRNMEERTKAMNGTFYLQSAPGVGTRIQAIMQIP